ncbi:MAG: triose-phosphate isomerase [Bacteroidales bacterium]|nr:triose-phosphate isomerase [Bacteroidales bacterium]MCR5192391.1 triose-phosphate isomerase [Bacteroidales bacterium]
MRKNIVAGNWKMNKSFEEADDLVNDIMTKLEENELGENTLMILCPPFPYLEMCQDYSNDSYFAIGAQNVNDNEKGAYTGEVSASMLSSMEIEYCIVGHSERRAYYGETDAIVARKVDRLLENEIRPIVCCGEVLEEREAGKQFEVVSRQIKDGLFHLDAEKFGQIIIAYEPVWAIGTGKTATPEQAQEIHAFIRNLIAEKYGKEVADNTSILYGGSCKPSNARELFANPDVDGGLIGGASLQADDFINIAMSF